MNFFCVGFVTKKKSIKKSIRKFTRVIWDEDGVRSWAKVTHGAHREPTSRAPTELWGLSSRSHWRANHSQNHTAAPEGEKGAVGVSQGAPKGNPSGRQGRGPGEPGLLNGPLGTFCARPQLLVVTKGDL